MRNALAGLKGVLRVGKNGKKWEVWRVFEHPYTCVPGRGEQAGRRALKGQGKCSEWLAGERHGLVRLCCLAVGDRPA